MKTLRSTQLASLWGLSFHLWTDFTSSTIKQYFVVFMLVNWNIYMLACSVEGIAKIIKSKYKLKENWQTNQELGTLFHSLNNNQNLYVENIIGTLCCNVYRILYIKASKNTKALLFCLQGKLFHFRADYMDANLFVVRRIWFPLTY